MTIVLFLHVLISGAGLIENGPAAQPQTCTYADWTWSAAERRAVDIREVEKPYSALRDDERDALTGCSICREDQVEIAFLYAPSGASS